MTFCICGAITVFYYVTGISRFYYTFTLTYIKDFFYKQED